MRVPGKQENFGDTFSHMYGGKFKNVTLVVGKECQLRCSYCFPAGTMIDLDRDMQMRIEDIQVGDRVLGFPEELAEQVSDKDFSLYQNTCRTLVTAVMDRIYTGKMVKLFLENRNMLHMTADHPVLCGRGFVPAEDIKVTDYVFDNLGRHINVSATEYYHVDDLHVYNLETDLHTFFAESALVHNCYEEHKCGDRMSFDTARRFVDLLFDMDARGDKYVNEDEANGLCLDFIGGEPLLEVELMDNICEYFVLEALRRNHRWATRYMISISTNGVAYFEPAVQHFFKKWGNKVSVGITIDGNKELHDKCRRFADGRPSYDLAAAAFKDAIKRYGYDGTKLTIARANLPYLATAFKDMINEFGVSYIQGNPVFEEEWNNEDANLYYHQIKEVADWLLEDDRWQRIGTSFLDQWIGHALPESDNQNWCWGAGTPILTKDGYRNIEDLQIGDLVFCEDGTLHPIVNTMSHFAENCVKIRTAGTYEMVCTDDHKLLAMPFKYLGWKSVMKYLPYGKYAVKDLGNNAGHKKSDKIQVFKLRNNTVSYDKNLAYLVGRFIGDRSNSETSGTTIVCGFHELDELSDKFDAANIEYGVTKGKTVYNFRVRKSSNRPENAELRRITEECGHGAANKHLPPECFFWDNESLQALLDGYIDSDGYYDNKTDSYKTNSISKRLCLELSIILNTLGCPHSCSITKRAGKGTIMGRTVNLHDRYDISFIRDVSRSRFYREFDGRLFAGNFSKTAAEPQMVYNITVDENHTYVAGGVVSSNCGGSMKMLCVDTDGKIYPCVRYSPVSIGEKAAGACVGDVDNGLLATEQQCSFAHCLDCITRRSASTEECWKCPIASGCASCNAWQFDRYGDANHRCTNICPMHKARVMASAYYYNKLWRLTGDESLHFDINIPPEWALPIVGKQEYELLLALAN